ncbi:MAG: M1 family aminopeptidase, partial [Gemmatimonadota bacterium]|nr:M1 family aminopeptidase [Gemmatimonadota bacterium]
MQWSCPHPMEEIYLIAGPYEVRERMHRGIRVMSFCYGNTGEDITDRYLDGTGAYLDLYGEMFGDYPFSKFALVENYWQTGYGMPSFTFLGDRVIRLPFILDTSYGHEILHNWWGNGVFVDVRGGNWCEGLTTYFADYLYKEVTGGSAGRDYRRDKLLGYRDFASGGGRDFPLSEFRQRDSAATQAVGYGKTMMVFHMLRTRLGEDVFLAGLRAVYRDHLFQEASWDDLRLSFEAVSGEDLAGWFDQWISRPGAIRLSVEGVAVQARGDSTVVSATLVQEEPCLETLVPVRVDAAGGEVARALIPMTGTRTAFEVAVHGSAEVLAVDPEFDIFRILHGEEIAPTLSGVLGADSTRIVIGKDVRPDIREALVAVAGEWAADSTISWVEEGTGTVEPD